MLFFISKKKHNAIMQEYWKTYQKKFDSLINEKYELEQKSKSYSGRIGGLTKQNNVLIKKLEFSKAEQKTKDTISLKMCTELRDLITKLSKENQQLKQEKKVKPPTIVELYRGRRNKPQIKK